MSDSDCCISKENGHKCTCIKTSYAYSQQAEDDGYGDYLLENKKDGDLEDKFLEEDADREMGDER